MCVSAGTLDFIDQCKDHRLWNVECLDQYVLAGLQLA
jgi:hypothetical protein